MPFFGEVEKQMEACVPLAPLHNPANLAGIRALRAATVQPSAGTSVGVKAKLVPAGLDELAAQVATVGDAGSLSLTAAGTKLTVDGVACAFADTATPLFFSVAVTVTPTVGVVGAVQGGVAVSVPLPELEGMWA